MYAYMWHTRAIICATLYLANSNPCPSAVLESCASPETGCEQRGGATTHLVLMFSVARGYLNKPEVSAEKFVMDPFDPAG